MPSDKDVSYLVPKPEGFDLQTFLDAAGIVEGQVKERDATEGDAVDSGASKVLVIHNEGFALSPQDVADLFK